MSLVSRTVLDASALLALIFGEPGAERLTSKLLENTAMSTVNLAEVQTKLVRAGDDPEQAWIETQSYIREIHPFEIEHAKLAGELVSKTHPFGLSLADRACFALAITLNAPVYTVDRMWKKVKVGVDVHVLR